MRCQYFQEISLIFVVGKLRKYIWYCLEEPLGLAIRAQSKFVKTYRERT